MIPILFSPSSTTFTGNGLGRLVDSPRCIVREERNGPYELEMDYPIGGQHFDEITHSAIILAVPADGKGAQPFRIYDISKPIGGLCTIYAEHISYQLAHIPVTPFGKVTSVASALNGLKNNAAETCPFTFWTNKVSAGTFEVKTPASIREMLGGTEGSILDAFGGGEYEWDGYTVKLYQNRGQDKGVAIRYGRNLTDLKQDEAIDSTITGVYPFWSDSNSGTLVTLPEKVLHSANAGNFPYMRTIVVDATSEFEGEPTESQLRAFGNTYITQTGIGVPKVSIKVSFAPLWQTEEYKDIANLERVNLCDTVTVEFEKLGVSASAKVVKTEYDVLTERYNSIELGDARTNLAKAVSENVSNVIKASVPSRSDIEKIVDAQTALITGGLGGYIRFVYNADGEPQELLFMDSDDIQTAVNVIRINKNGIGFSNDGYDPTKFVSAWTIDGKFSADFIAAGTMLANYIKGGTLSLGGSNNGNGVIVVYNASGTKIGQWDNSGLSASGDLIVKNGYYTAQFTDVTYPVMALGVGITWETTKGYSVDAKGISQNLLSGKYIAPQTNGSMYEVEISTNRHVCSNKYVCIDGTNRNVGVMFTWAYQNSSNCVTLTRVGLDGTNYQTLIGINYTSSSNSATMSVSGKQLAFVSSSARRYKHAVKPIKDSELDPHKLLDLTVVQFEWNDDHNLQYEDMRGKVIPGIIAEDVEKIYPSAVIHNPETGEVESWDERRIMPGMLALIQEQDKKIKELEARLAKLEEALCRVQ